MTPIEGAASLALKLIKAGVPVEEAINRACDEIAVRMITLGDDLLEEAQSTVQKVGSVVSPWLWILSIGGFAMAVMNRQQIQKMYGSWKRAKRDLFG